MNVYFLDDGGEFLLGDEAIAIAVEDGVGALRKVRVHLYLLLLYRVSMKKWRGAKRGKEGMGRRPRGECDEEWL